MNLGPMEIAIIAILIFALFGYKKLPDATRAVGRSLRIFKGEMKGMKDDDVSTRAEAQTVRAPIEQPAPNPMQTPAAPPAQPQTVQPPAVQPPAVQPQSTQTQPSTGDAAMKPTQAPPPSQP